MRQDSGGKTHSQASSEIGHLSRRTAALQGLPRVLHAMHGSDSPRSHQQTGTRHHLHRGVNSRHQCAQRRCGWSSDRSKRKAAVDRWLDAQFENRARQSGINTGHLGRAAAGLSTWRLTATRRDCCHPPRWPSPAPEAQGCCQLSKSKSAADVRSRQQCVRSCPPTFGGMP